MQPRMPGSRLRPRKHRREDLVGKQSGSALEQCTLEDLAWYPAQPDVSEIRIATNAPLLLEHHQQWQRHFIKVLNMRSQFEDSDQSGQNWLQTNHGGTDNRSCEAEGWKGRWQLSHPPRDADGWMLHRRILDSPGGLGAHDMGGTESA